MSSSCVGCKFLYQQDDGYSNWTVMDTIVNCAKDKNPNLPLEEPCDWNINAEEDNWPKTANGRCESFSPGPMVRLDVDGENSVEGQTEDLEAREAIMKHSGREL